MALKDYVLALRPWSLSASLIPVTLGAVLSYKCHENFHPVLYLVTVGSVLAVHGAGNAVNTFYDFEKGVDTQQSDDRTLVDHRLKPGDVVSLGMYLYLLAMLCLWLVIWLSTAKAQIIALLFFCGLSGSFMYTGGIGLKYYALGDFIIIVAFGPLAVLFSFTVQAGHIHLTPLVLAVPLALHTEAALHCNNARDLVTDKRVGVVTLAILVYFLWGMWYSGWLGLPCLTIFFSFHLERQFREGKLRHLPKETAKLNTISAILFVCGCVMSKSTSIPFLQCYNSG
jgi:1,4-dihydroxy-2-naphthoate octaprenyltransferase